MHGGQRLSMGDSLIKCQQADWPAEFPVKGEAGRMAAELQEGKHNNRDAMEKHSEVHGKAGQSDVVQQGPS